MERNYIKDLKAGKEVLIKGWVHEIRDLSKLKFLLIRDMSGIIQCVVKGDLMGKISDLSLESAVEIKGNVKAAKVKADLTRGDVELEVTGIEILNRAEKLPIHVNEKTVNTDLVNRLDNRFLDTFIIEI